MKKVLYKDDEFELTINDTVLYLYFNCELYELSSHPYEPCTYIKSKDGTVNITMHGAFDFGQLISSSRGWICDSFSPLQLCEALKAAILKDKARVT